MKKTVTVLVSALAAVALLAVVPLLGIAAGAASAACSGANAGDVDTRAVAAQVKAILSGGDEPKVSVPGLDDPVDQVPNAKAIAATGVARVPTGGDTLSVSQPEGGKEHCGPVPTGTLDATAADRASGVDSTSQEPGQRPPDCPVCPIRPE